MTYDDLMFFVLAFGLLSVLLCLVALVIGDRQRERSRIRYEIVRAAELDARLNALFDEAIEAEERGMV